MENRVKIIMKTSIIGIVANVVLAIFKIIVGSIVNAISVTMDGINNLSDAGSSLITILGTAFAGKAPDKKHPFGYGRVEYLSSLLISGLILYTGVTSFVESVKGILNPETAEYSAVTLVVIGVAVLLKLAIALFTQTQGKKANSDSLVASGKEALLDVFVSTATVVAAIIYLTLNISLEAYLAAIISLIIIKAGVDLLKEIVSKIIGEPGDVDLIISLKRTIASFDKVNGAYDLILNNYGPDRYLGSVHIEVDDTIKADELDELTRNITEKVIVEHGVVLSAIGIYSHNTIDSDKIAMEKEVKEYMLSKEYILGLHGFYVDFVHSRMRFDLVISMDSKDRFETYNNALKDLREKYPDFEINAGIDTDFNELRK